MTPGASAAAAKNVEASSSENVDSKGDYAHSLVRIRPSSLYYSVVVLMYYSVLLKLGVGSSVINSH